MQLNAAGPRLKDSKGFYIEEDAFYTRNCKKIK